MLGDLETAIILLEHKAHTNAPGVQGGYCALDGAARHGRLDMVMFLLSASSLSQYRGSTGYDGAIECAEKHGHFAVADLIRKHAAGGGSLDPQFVPGQQGSNESQYL